MPPKHAGVKESWDEWFEGWKLWFKQVGMNCWYGRGGLNVKVRVCSSSCATIALP
jgi:hypothetical protein